MVLGPLREFGHCGLPGLDGLAQESFRLGPVGRVIDGADAPRHGFALIQARDVGLRILLHMALTALPRDTGEDGPPGRLEAGMSVGDEALDAFQATPEDPVEAGAPMDLGLAQGDGHAPPTALAICGHTDRYQYRN